MNNSLENQRLADAVAALASTITEIITERLRTVSADRTFGPEPGAVSSENGIAPESPTAYLTKAQVAKHLQVTGRTVDNWMARGILPYFKIGRNVRFRLSDIEDYLNRRNRVGR